MRELWWILVLGPLACLSLMGCPEGDDDDSAGDDDDATADDDDATADDDDATADDDDATADDDDATPGDCGADWQVVTFETSDGETLEADWKPAASADSGAVVLFHMIPPNNDRSGYPLDVREAFSATGVAVLSVDRRGAGGSTGVPSDAYTGIGGQLDMEAAIGFLLSAEQGCAVDDTKLVLVGASNGTTSVYDYTVNHDAAWPMPAANIFMSPGGYTAGNHAFSPQQADWGVSLSFPFLWLYPTDEPWSEAFVPDAPGAWEFIERGSAHGTQMFDGGQLQDDTVADMVRWIEAVQ